MRYRYTINQSVYNCSTSRKRIIVKFGKKNPDIDVLFHSIHKKELLEIHQIYLSK